MNLGMYAYSESSIEEISRIRKRNSFNADVGTGDESDAGAQETTPILKQQKKRFGACGVVWPCLVDRGEEHRTYMVVEPTSPRASVSACSRNGKQQGARCKV